MLNILSLILLLILFIFLFTFLFYKPCQENFVDKSNEHIFTLKNNAFKFDNSTVTINPAEDLKPNLSNLDFSFSSEPEIHTIDFLKFKKNSDLVYNLTSPENNMTINISFHSSPISIVVNNYEYTIELKDSEKFPGVQNIFIYQKLCGSIKDGKILKSIRPEIYEHPDIICAIYVSFMILQKIKQIKNIDYDEYFLNKKYES